MRQAVHRETIIEAALRLFSQRGFKETTIFEIARHAKVAEGTIFHHFGSKQDLLLVILDKVRSDITGRMDRHLAAEDFEDGISMVEGMIGLYFHLADSMQTEFLFLLRNYPYQLAYVNPVCRSHLEKIHDCFLDAFSGAIARGVTDCTIREVDPHRQAVVLLATVTGLARFKLFALMPVDAYLGDALLSCRKMLERR